MRPTPTLDTICSLLAHHPDGLTAQEIALELDRKFTSIWSTIYQERQRHGSERVRIVRWENARGHGGKERPVFGNGPGKDAKHPPKRPHKVVAGEARSRYYFRNKAKVIAQQRAKRYGLAAHPFDGLVQQSLNSKFSNSEATKVVNET